MAPAAGTVTVPRRHFFGCRAPEHVVRANLRSVTHEATDAIFNVMKFSSGLARRRYANTCKKINPSRYFRIIVSLARRCISVGFSEDSDAALNQVLARGDEVLTEGSHYSMG